MSLHDDVTELDKAIWRFKKAFRETAFYKFHVRILDWLAKKLNQIK